MHLQQVIRILIRVMEYFMDMTVCSVIQPIKAPGVDLLQNSDDSRGIRV